MKKLSLIVPFYNEEEMLPLFFEKINEIISEIKDYKTTIVAVNDGSKDKTLELLKAQKEKQDNIIIVSFSRNFGHEAAVSAGFRESDGDICIVMDADLQDPPSVILKLIEKYEEGYQVVNAKRVDRSKDSFLKRKTAEWYYKLIKKMSGKIQVPENVGNYRLLSRQVVDHLIALKEKNRVFRVEVPYLGFKTATVEFVRQERPKGKSHYNYKSMFRLAFDSIVSSSNAPLLYSMTAGIIIGILSCLAYIADLVLFILKIDNFDFGLFTIVITIFFCTAIILVFLGVIGIYLSRIMIETRDRPEYIIDEIIK